MRNHKNIALYAAIIACCLFLLPIASARAEDEIDVRLPPKASIDPVLSTQLDPNTEFTNSDGNKVTLKSLIMPGKPALIMPVYFECPRLCGLVMNGVLDMLEKQTLELGKDFSIITFSINPKETFDLAAQKRAAFQKELEGVGKKIDGWNFLVADAETIKKTTAALGFNYIPEGEGDFSHGAAVFVLTKDAVLSQYFTGIIYGPSDVRLALVDASMGNIGTPIDHILLLCSSFDPKLGKYNWAVARVLQMLGTVMILFVGGIIVFFVVKERRKKTLPSSI